MGGVLGTAERRCQADVDQAVGAVRGQAGPELVDDAPIIGRSGLRTDVAVVALDPSVPHTANRSIGPSAARAAVPLT